MPAEICPPLVVKGLWKEDGGRTCRRRCLGTWDLRLSLQDPDQVFEMNRRAIDIITAFQEENREQELRITQYYEEEEKKEKENKEEEEEKEEDEGEEKEEEEKEKKKKYEEEKENEDEKQDEGDNEEKKEEKEEENDRKEKEQVEKNEGQNEAEEEVKKEKDEKVFEMNRRAIDIITAFQEENREQGLRITQYYDITLSSLPHTAIWHQGQLHIYAYIETIDTLRIITTICRLHQHSTIKVSLLFNPFSAGICLFKYIYFYTHTLL
ncbi:cilia- and flagella-associated protein 251-like isoform X8 [Hyla sarda]|uniref:cilia- and flagella-associated protein 251-like isoform X8 n=1 Tax=Hyla sarda TaxID=327740 RepID=UPI0024C42B3D|nr:cilia- and flagella-associated protein 251-like isoform X8 [Hyla sarda]